MAGLIWLWQQGSGGTNHTVAVQDAALAWASDAVTLTQDHVLGVQAADLALTADAATVQHDVVDRAVGMQDASFALTAESVTLLQDHLVSIVGADLPWAADAVTLTQDQVLAAQDAVLAWAAGAVTVSSGGGSGASAAEIWAYEIAPGISVLTAINELWRVHGLKPGEPMTVTPTGRTSGDISQTITGDGTTISTVTRV